MSRRAGLIFSALSLCLALACSGAKEGSAGDPGGGASGGLGGSASGGSAGLGAMGGLGGTGDAGGLGGMGGLGGTSGAGGSGTGGLGGTSGAGGSGGGADPSDEIFDPNNIPRFDLEIDAAGLSALKTAPREYVRATFRYGSETLTEVGVHLKGQSSFREMDKKAAFKVKFDEFVPDQEFHGLRRLTLNNMLDDWSMISERLAYTVFRSSGLAAPRANHALVYVNGEPYGVYANVESSDKTFLARWYPSNDGNLYEKANELHNDAGYQDWKPGNEQEYELETNETKNDRSDLTELFAAATGAADATLLADVAHILDTEQFLRFAALEAILNQQDGYGFGLWGPNNHRLYNDPDTGKFTLIPWGMDMALKSAGSEGFVHVHEALGYFLKRCIATEACKAAYDAAIESELQRFEALDLPSLASAVFEQMRTHILDDPRKEESNSAIQGGVDAVVAFGREQPARVRTWLAGG